MAKLFQAKLVKREDKFYCLMNEVGAETVYVIGEGCVTRIDCLLKVRPVNRNFII